MVLALPSLSLAATLNVNSTADTLVAGDGQCTLREAILNANGDSDTTGGDCAAGSGADLIEVPAGSYVLTIPSDNPLADTAEIGDLDIAGDLTLRGAGAAVTIIDAAGIDGVAQIQWGAVTLERLTLRGGVGIFGAGVSVVDGAVTVSECVISGNSGVIGSLCFCFFPPCHCSSWSAATGGVLSLGGTTLFACSLRSARDRPCHAAG
jgi:CSLREA domain-containing protein